MEKRGDTRRTGKGGEPGQTGRGRGCGGGGREGERVRENQRGGGTRQKARWRSRERERERESQGGKDTKKEEKEVTGRGRMNFRVSFYRKLQRDNSRLVPINFMVLMIPTERHRSRVELNKSE